jgi:hypothetical protein
LRKAAESVHLRSALQKLNRARVIEAITKLASEPKS